jgi:hypothetical protein
VRPGVNVTTRDTAPPSTVPTDVGTGFMIGVTEAGPTLPTTDDLVQNMDAFTAKYAPSGRSFAAGITMHDSAEEFFAQGGNRLFIGRVVGPAAKYATVSLLDGTAATALVVTASSVGAHGNNIDVKIDTKTENPDIATGSYRITLIDETDGSVLDASPDLNSVGAATTWAMGSLVSIAAGTSSSNPIAGTFDLATGADDIAGITDSDWQDAVDSLGTALGPGILFAPGATTGTIYNILAEGALSGTRVAFFDGADTPNANTLITAVKTIVDSTLKRSRFGGLFTPWLIVPGLTTGTVRKVPPTAAVAGKFAANVAAGYSANQPAAGELGRLETVLDYAQTFSDADLVKLNANGVNVIRDIYGVTKIYGWRSTADPVNDPRWIALSNSILHRQIAALCQQVGERFIFRQIDGRGSLVGEFGAALSGEVCMPMYLGGSLYGATATEAYKVDVGPSVNTLQTIANNELRAVVSIKMAPFGEEVNIEIVKYLVTEVIPA